MTLAPGDAGHTVTFEMRTSSVPSILMHHSIAGAAGANLFRILFLHYASTADLQTMIAACATKRLNP